MPETDVGEVAARIGADPEFHNTPIVFLTALVTRAQATSGLTYRRHVRVSYQRPFAGSLTVSDSVTPVDDIAADPQYVRY